MLPSTSHTSLLSVEKVTGLPESPPVAATLVDPPYFASLGAFGGEGDLLGATLARSSSATCAAPLGSAQRGRPWSALTMQAPTPVKVISALVTTPPRPELTVGVPMVQPALAPSSESATRRLESAFTLTV